MFIFIAPNHQQAGLYMIVDGNVGPRQVAASQQATGLSVRRAPRKLLTLGDALFGFVKAESSKHMGRKADVSMPTPLISYVHLNE